MILNQFKGLLKSFNQFRHKIIKNLIKSYCYIKIIFKNVSIGKGAYIHLGAKIDTPRGGTIHIGNNCEIHKGAMILTYGGDIKIGDNCSINPYCVIYGAGGLSIGNGVRIATHTVIVPANHNFNDLDKDIYEQGSKCLGITIEDDVWIGAGAKILDGVVISKGCVIAAGAVVTKSTQNYGVYAGVPAKLIKLRDRNE